MDESILKYLKPFTDFTWRNIEAYADLSSVKQNDTINFHVWSNTPYDFTVEFIRKGISDASMLTDTGYAENYATKTAPYMDGCGWPVCYTLTIPSNWTSGAYIALFTIPGAEVEVLFFVKPANPGINTKILFQSSANTSQAYNNWPGNPDENAFGIHGKSLYDYNSYGPPTVPGTGIFRSFKVSFNRPMNLYDFYKWELPFIQWLEKNSYTVEYCTNVDLHEDSTLLNNYKLFLSVGHDEYWSMEMRDHINIFSNNNGNIAFFSGNTCWWQVRYEQKKGNKMLVCYKDENYDPEPYPKKTVNWYTPQIDKPENLMTGVSFFNGVYHDPPSMPDAFFKAKLNKHWLLRNTGLKFDGQFGVYNNSVINKHYQTIGYETDAAEYTDFEFKFPLPTGKLPIDIPGKSAPKDFMVLANSNLTNWGENGLGSSGYNNHNGWVTMGIFRVPFIFSGGFRFTAGTTDWSIGLLYIVENQNVEDPWNEIHQITKNVIDILSAVIFLPQPFLLDNPDFENWTEISSGIWNPDGWYKEGSGNIEKSSPGHSGQYCLKVDAVNGQTWVSQNYIPVRTNRQYSVRCWAKGSDPTNTLISTITIRLQTTDGYSDFAIANYNGGTAWQEISAIGIINSSETKLQPVRVKIQVSSGTIAYFDEVVVEEL